MDPVNVRLPMWWGLRFLARIALGAVVGGTLLPVSASGLAFFTCNPKTFSVLPVLLALVGALAGAPMGALSRATWKSMLYSTALGAALGAALLVGLALLLVYCGQPGLSWTFSTIAEICRPFALIGCLMGALVGAWASILVRGLMFLHDALHKPRIVRRLQSRTRSDPVLQERLESFKE